jgi:hypothetical protein
MQILTSFPGDNCVGHGNEKEISAWEKAENLNNKWRCGSEK